MNFYKHHLGDYAAGTLHLTWDEDCAYRRLIDQYYKREAPIPCELKEACRLVRASTPTQRRAVESVLREFFDLQDDGWHQKRCDQELASANAQADTNRRIAEEREAKKRARKEHEPLHESFTASSTNRSPAFMGERAPSQTPDSKSQTPDLTHSATALVPAAAAPDDGGEDLIGRLPRPEGGPPACPHEQILRLWAELAPELPQPAVWTEKRRKLLQTRWRETAVAEKWKDTEDGLRHFAKLFRFIKTSKFLTGKAPAGQGRQVFTIDLEWLFNATNWVKVIEGKYHPED